MELVGNRRHQASQPGLIAIARPLEVEVHPVEALRFDRADKRLRKCDGGGCVRSQLVERMLIEVIYWENSSSSGTMSPGDQCGQRLAFVAVPASTGLIQRSVGVDPDG